MQMVPIKNIYRKYFIIFSIRRLASRVLDKSVVSVSNNIIITNNIYLS